MFDGHSFSSSEHDIMSLKADKEFEGTPQQQQQEEQKIAPGSRRYELRASRESEIGQNLSLKRKAGHTSPRPVNKRLKTGDPCDHPLRSGVCADVGVAERDPRSLIGRRIEVFRHVEKVWYSGKLVRYDVYNQLHLVAYKDGEGEWVSVQRDKVKLLESSATLSKAPTRRKEGNSEETKSKHGFVEKSGGGIKAEQGTAVNTYVRKRKFANISKQNDFHKGKHGGRNDIIQNSAIGGESDSEQKDSSGSLKWGCRMHKRIKKDLKEVEISGTEGLNEDNVRVGVVSDQGEKVSVGVVSDLPLKGDVNEIRTTEDVPEGVVIRTCAEQGSCAPNAEIKSKPITRFTYRRRRQRTCVPLCSGRDEVGNSHAVVHQRPVDVDSKTPNAYEGTKFVQPIEWIELFIVDKALHIHTSLHMSMFTLSLRQPSYWQCVAPAMQLCKRGKLEMVKSQSFADLVLVLGSILHFISGNDKKSSSFLLMKQFRARILNCSESGTIMASLESLKPMATYSDIDVQICEVGNMPSLRQLHLWRSFQKVFLPEHGVFGMGNGSMRITNLHAALEPFSVCCTSLEAGLCCPSICNSDNIHGAPRAEDNDLSCMSKTQHLSDSSGGSAANDDSLALVPVEGLVNYARDTDIINVSQPSTKNIYFNFPSSSLYHSENVCAIQSLQMSNASAPSLFTNLHQRRLLGSNSYNQLSLQSLPKRLPRSTIRFPRTKREYTRILVRPEWNDPLVQKSWSVKALVSSSKNDSKDNRHYPLPVLKFQKNSTNFGKWCCELNSPLGHGRSGYCGTTKRNVNVIAAPDGLLGNVNAVAFRSPRSARPGRPAGQCRKENRLDKLNGPVMDFSKSGSELDSLSCTTNILIVRVDRGWRESNAEVALKSYTNEWTLDVKLQGFTRFTYKPQEAKISKAQEEIISRAPGQVHNRSKSHITIWKSGGDWSLEFPNRHQWCLFKKLYRECYERNNGSFSLKYKDIPLPGVYLVDNDSNLTDDIVPFVRPLHYIKETEDEVRKAISSNHVLYDMDSDDERWLCQFNSNAYDKVSYETFERIINELEKVAFVTQPDLTINDAVKNLSWLVPVEVLTSIYSQWEEKRNKKGTALVRQFQTGMSRRSLSKNGSAQSSKGKQRPAIGPRNRARNQGIRVPGSKITLKDQGTGMQHGKQKEKANSVPFDNELSSRSLGQIQLQQQQLVNVTPYANNCSSLTSGPVSFIDYGLQKDTWEIDAHIKSREICVPTQKRVHNAALQKERENKIDNDLINIEAEANIEALREISAIKSRRVQRLTQNLDLKAYIAGKAVRNAEINKARPLCLDGKVVTLELSTDGRPNANAATRECSMGSSYCALVANGH